MHRIGPIPGGAAAAKPEPQREAGAIQARADNPGPPRAELARDRRVIGGVAKARARDFPIDVDGQGLPPRTHARIRQKDVQRVLNDMFAPNDAPVIPPALPRSAATYEEMDGYGARLYDTDDARFAMGVRLTASGREVLAGYYARKYGIDVHFHERSAHEVHNLASRLLTQGRQIAGPEAREVHYFGHDDAHAMLVVYLRQHGEEALMVFDSGAPPTMHFGKQLAEDCARVTGSGKPVRVFQHIWGLQHDGSSCWLYAMKAAVALAGRRPTPTGPSGGFIRPELMAALERRRVACAAPDGVVPIWSLPELARMGQSLKTISAHAGPDAAAPLVTSESGETLAEFLERFTYLSDGKKLPDYMRQKGHRVAEILDIEAWGREIGRQLGDQEWSVARQTDFTTRMKQLVRGDARPPLIEDDLDDLNQLACSWNLLEDIQLFADLACSASERFKEMDPLGLLGNGLERLERLVGMLSPTGLDEAEQYFDDAHSSFEQLQAVLEAAWNVVKIGSPVYVSGRLVSSLYQFEHVIAPDLAEGIERLQAAHLAVCLEKVRRAEMLEPEVG